MARVPVAKGIFTWPSDEPRLIGSRCAACGIVTFPAQDSCPRCASTEMAEHLLSRRGRLWAWTTQEFPPPTPPYAGPRVRLRAVRGGHPLGLKVAMSLALGPRAEMPPTPAHQRIRSHDHRVSHGPHHRRLVGPRRGHRARDGRARAGSSPLARAGRTAWRRRRRRPARRARRRFMRATWTWPTTPPWSASSKRAKPPSVLRT